MSRVVTKRLSFSQVAVKSFPDIVKSVGLLQLVGICFVIACCGYVLWDARRLSLLSMLSLCYLINIRKRRRWWLFYLLTYRVIGLYGVFMGLWVVFTQLKR